MNARHFTAIALVFLFGGALVSRFLPGQDIDSAKLVRQIRLPALTLFHDATNPLLLDSLDEAKRAFPEPATLKIIMAEVDFAKQRLLYFQWEGSGHDRLTPVVAVTSKRKTVRFGYHPGATTDLRAHHALFAVDRDVEYAGSGLWAHGGSFTRIYRVHIKAEKCTTRPGDFTKPTVIANEMELAKELGNPGVVAETRRAFAIDFRTQRLLLFCWQCKNDTDVGYVVRAEYKDVAWRLLSKATFYQTNVGKGDLSQRCLILYAMPKDTAWEALPAGELPFRLTPR